MSLAGKVEKREREREPVAWLINHTYRGVTITFTTTHTEDIKHYLAKRELYKVQELYTTPQQCPKCEERKTTALNYISLTFEFEQLQSKCEKLKAERDELAARVEKMRGALDNFIEHGYSQLAVDIANEALALPDISTGILNRVRAETLSNAAKWFRTMRPFDVQPGGHSEIAAVLIDRLAKQAADMEAGK